jgi:hypothetical protein
MKQPETVDNEGAAPVDSVTRDLLGQLVRHVWVEWAKEQPNPKASWLLPWEKLSDADREVDRRIGAVLFRLGLDSAVAVCLQRAESERIYNDAGRGERYATPYRRAAEDIEAFKFDSRLRGLTGAYPGTSVENPVDRIRAILKRQP